MGLRNFVQGVFPELQSAEMHVGAAEVPAGDWVDPDLDPSEYRAFLEASRQRARQEMVHVVLGQVIADEEG